MVRKRSLATCLVFVSALALGGCSLTTSKLGGAAQFDALAERSELAAQGPSAAANDREDARTFPEDALPRREAMEIVTVRNDRGGYVVDYAMLILKLQENNTAVRFSGRCDSACTLYLALPQDQTCIAPGASFRFHSPRASTRQASRAAKTYMLKAYPEWVTAWIEARGGLSYKLKTMDYSYASKYLRPCGATAMGKRPSIQEVLG
jgi:hypothetical protein